MRNIWIVVANTSEAKIYQSQHLPRSLEPVETLQHPLAHAKKSDLVSDRLGEHQGRTPGGQRAPGSTYEPSVDPKQTEAVRFARRVADFLNKARRYNQYQELILVAPAQFQGLLNYYCDDHVLALVTAHAQKDYTQLKERELKQHLEELVRLH